MDKINAMQLGGFPLETDTLDFMQGAWNILNTLGHIAGDKTILVGCVETGSTVSSGYVFYNGEVLPFEGGQKQTYVRLTTENISKTFENGDTKQVYQKRSLTFGSSLANLKWSDFTRPFDTSTLTGMVQSLNAIPVGCIVMWSGAIVDIPAGWKLCDGTNDTPDLKGKFIVGYDPGDGDYDAIGKYGGDKTITLNIDQMPAHDHDGTTEPAGRHDHGYETVTQTGTTEFGLAGGGKIWEAANSYTEEAEEHEHTFTTSPKGSSQPHENRPPYYTLAYIMFKGI